MKTDTAPRWKITARNAQAYEPPESGVYLGLDRLALSFVAPHGTKDNNAAFDATRERVDELLRESLTNAAALGARGHLLALLRATEKELVQVQHSVDSLEEKRRAGYRQGENTAQYDNALPTLRDKLEAVETKQCEVGRELEKTTAAARGEYHTAVNAVTDAAAKEMTAERNAILDDIERAITPLLDKLLPAQQRLDMLALICRQKSLPLAMLDDGGAGLDAAVLRLLEHPEPAAAVA